MLSLRRKTAVDELIESIPRPQGGTPQNSLPGWEKLPLDSKLPMLKFPTNNDIIFSRSKIGEKVGFSDYKFIPRFISVKF